MTFIHKCPIEAIKEHLIQLLGEHVYVTFLKFEQLIYKIALMR